MFFNSRFAAVHSGSGLSGPVLQMSRTAPRILDQAAKTQTPGDDAFCYLLQSTAKAIHCLELQLMV